MKKFRKFMNNKLYGYLKWYLCYLEDDNKWNEEEGWVQLVEVVGIRGIFK